MLRIRLTWFVIGFSVTGAAVAQFSWRGLMADRFTHSSRVKLEFDALDSRVTVIESLRDQSPQVD